MWFFAIFFRKKIPTLRNLSTCPVDTCQCSCAKEIHFKNHRDKHLTENEEALLPHTVGNVLDKNLEEPLSDGFSRDWTQIRKQLLLHQNDWLLDLWGNFSDLRPSADNLLGEALIDPIPVKTNEGINPLWQSVQKLALMEKAAVENSINQISWLNRKFQNVGKARGLLQLYSEKTRRE